MKPTLLLIAIICQSCMSSLPLTISQADYNSIPYGTKAIQINSPLSPDSLFKLISLEYAQIGCPVKSNKEAMQIICDGLPTEHSGTVYALTSLAPTASGTMVKLTATAQISESQANMARAISGMHSYQAERETVSFLKSSGNKNYFFQHLVQLANTIPGTKTYLAK